MVGALEMAKASRTVGVAIMGRQLINNFIFLFEYLWVWGRQRKKRAVSDVGSEHVPIPCSWITNPSLHPSTGIPRETVGFFSENPSNALAASVGACRVQNRGHKPHVLIPGGLHKGLPQHKCPQGGEGGRELSHLASQSFLPHRGGSEWEGEHQVPQPWQGLPPVRVTADTVPPGPATLCLCPHQGSASRAQPSSGMLDLLFPAWS